MTEKSIYIEKKTLFHGISMAPPPCQRQFKEAIEKPLCGFQKENVDFDLCIVIM